MTEIIKFLSGLIGLKSRRKISLTACILIFLTTGNQIFAQDKLEISISTKKNSDNFEVHFSPPKAHHFNLKAPNKIKESIDKTLQDTNVMLNKDLIVVSPKNKELCELTFKIYVCDDADTFCIPKENTFLCSTNTVIETVVPSKVAKDSSDNKDKIAKKASSLFILNNPSLALQKAKVENKPILIDFFGTWCPPCNVLDETVFNHPKFASYKDKMIFLKLDADLPISWELKAKYQIRGYPTIVFVTPNNEEIYRIIGSLQPNSFFRKMDFAIKNKNMSIKDIQIAFNKNKTPENAWKLIEAFNNQETYEEAYKVLPFALKKSNLSAKEQDLLQYIPLKANYSSLTKESKTKFIDFIKNSIEAYPYEETFLDKLNILDSIAEETKDEALKKWVALQTLRITNDMMTKKLSDDSFISKTDILFIRADAFEKLGSKTEAQFVYKMAAQEIESLIKKYKLDIKTNRGFNLDRVYAIFKSGDNQTANTLYTDLIKVYPEEFTFYYNHASVLKELGKKEDSLAQAKKALEYSYGDNKLRAAYFTADLLKTLEQKEKALNILEDAIKTAQLPDDKSIRTHRYYKKLVDLKEQLSK
jgi:thiol-disulfide isomerase/thioredoxin